MDEHLLSMHKDLIPSSAMWNNNNQNHWSYLVCVDAAWDLISGLLDSVVCLLHHMISEWECVWRKRAYMYKQTVHIAAVCLDTASCIPCDFSPGDLVSIVLADSFGWHSIHSSQQLSSCSLWSGPWHCCLLPCLGSHSLVLSSLLLGICTCCSSLSCHLGCV